MKKRVERFLGEASRICEMKKIRFTPLRSRVLRIVLKSRSPIKAYEILAQLKKEKKNPAIPKPPTVYRALDFLLSSGLIHRLNSLGSYTICTHPSLHRQCFFMICRSCGKAEEHCTPEISQSVMKLSREKNFVVDAVTVEIEGLCPRCQ